MGIITIIITIITFILLNDGPVRVLSPSSVQWQWRRHLCLPDLQLSDVPTLTHSPDCVTLPHTEVHSSALRVPARHRLPAVSHPVSGGEPSPPVDLTAQ